MTSSNRNLGTEFIAAALLYRLVEKEETIPLILTKTSFEFVEEELGRLASLGAIETNAEDNQWDVTEKGVALFEQLLDEYEAFIDLDVFAAVNLSIELEDELFDEDGFVVDGELDPRFEEPTSDAEAETLGTTDLRLPVVDFFAQRFCSRLKKNYTPQLRQEVLSRLVFLQELGSDRFADDKVFFDLKLGGITEEINEIVSSVPPWLELAREFDPPEKLMDMIIQAGFRDAKKREMLLDEGDCAWLKPSGQAEVIEKLLKPLLG